MNVVWSNRALRSLADIHSHISADSEKRAANRPVDGILKRGDHLAAFPPPSGPLGAGRSTLPHRVPRNEMNGQSRSQIHPGMRVRVVEKQNQRTGKLTEGIVQRILTNSPHHPHGIKVMLENGVVGRVKEIVSGK